MHCSFLWWTALAILAGAGPNRGQAGDPAPREPAAVQLATFVADLTPAKGEIVYAGLGNDPQQRDVRAARIEHPILAKGIVLKDAGGVYVLCAFDWTGICNMAHDKTRQKLAAAAGTNPWRVAAQSLHQHTAPAPDTTTQWILDQVPGGLKVIEA